MVVCKFYQQGYCRYGNSCKFEHPAKTGQQNYNRFGALSGQQGQSSNRNAGPAEPSYPGLTAESIERDLRYELPQWILSSYGPGKDAPEQLWGGYPREQSPEEIRLHFMMGALAGNPQGALADIQNLYQSAQQQIQHTLNNLPAAIQYVIDGEKKHPNRIDICKGTSGAAPSDGPFGGTPNALQSTPQQNPFGSPMQQPAAGGFGQPSAVGQKPNPFGSPAGVSPFSQLAKPAASPFGQAPGTGLGQTAGSAFGQPSALGSSSPFGKPAQPASAFGQTSALGAKPNPFGTPPAQPAFGQSGFGQPATLGVKPNPFGSPASGGPFGTAQQQAPATNPFGTPQQPAAPSPFGQPQPAQTAGPFGQPAAANPFGGTPAAQASPFAQVQQQQQAQQQQQTSNPFGGQAAAAPGPVNPFGQPSASSQFAQPSTSSPFAQPSTSSPFAQPSTNSPFGQPGAPAATATQAGTTTTGPYGPNATRQHPDISSYAAFNPDKTLRMFKGKPVQYQEPRDGVGKPVPLVRNFDGTSQRIWMPNGPPAYTTQTEAEPEKYQDPGVMEQWKAFVETGKFAGGIMPEVAPKREFCMWDF
ncbi:hypothetical protein VTJ49DRAFT_3279 [Mycothermus thermophilus]|uniref:C3H1-type domain-containing protein n=1 Tax=Humicola insolens TaxID=85995 RepID=A0ABR3V7W3_HUMIN